MTTAKQSLIMAGIGVLGVVAGFAWLPGFFGQLAFIGGLGFVFAAMILPLMKIIPRKTLSWVALLSAVFVAFCYYRLRQEANLSVIFSPWLLGYPAVGVVINVAILKFASNEPGH
ncbi:hypothetical protein [Corynebacterium sp. H113]|uniref:hypothetical protein n=1 Tax=Corynebacterium sp. H113 TaxID=3133419 RepID=UPI0030AC1C36